MSDDEETGKKGFDISKLAEKNDRYQSVGARLAAEFDRINPALSAFSKIHEASALSALSKTIDAAGISATQRALDESGLGAASRVMREMDLAGAGALAQVARNVDMSSVGMLAEPTKDIDFGGINAATRLMLDMDAIGGGAFAKLAHGLDTGGLAQAVRLMDMTGLQNVMRTLDTGDVGRAIAEVNQSLNLGLPSAFGQDLQLAVGSIADHVQALWKVGFVAQMPFEALGLASLEALLAKSLAVQEALLDEHRQAALDAQGEAKFHRRLAVVLAIVNIIMLLMTMVSTVQDWATDEDAATEANTAAIIEMHEAFDAMATEMEAMREAQKAEAERRSEADAEIAGILRDIAEVLGEQAEPEK